MKQIRKYINAAVSIVFATTLLMTTAAAPLAASAATVTSYDNTRIEDDLQEIDTSAYIKDTDGEAQLINEMGLVEYAYSEDEAISRAYFGVFFYVYNPTCVQLSTRAGANVVNMAISYNADGNPSEYANLELIHLDHTDDHLFYKFKLKNSVGAYTRAKAYARAHEGKRRYDVAGIQLWETGATLPVDHPIGKKFIATGYSKGCGSNSEAESTLELHGDMIDVIKLELHSTAYRFPWTSEEGAGHYYQLNSVYFGIDKGFSEKYGELYQVKCSWDEQKTSPIIVTNNASLYSMASKWIGQKENISDQFGIYDKFSNVVGQGMHSADWGWGYKYNAENSDVAGVAVFDDTAPGYIFYSKKSNVQDERITSQDMKDWIVKHNSAEYLFADEVDEGRVKGPQEYTFTADETIDLLSFNSTASGWAKFVNSWRLFWGGVSTPSYATSNPFWLFERAWKANAASNVGEDEIVEPIKRVVASDFTGVDASDRESLFVHEDDFKHFKGFYDSHSRDQDVFLLRFAVTDYYSAMQTVITAAKWYDPSTWASGAKDTTSTYMAQETIFRQFDVIELGFKRDGKLTIIGVVASPIDVVGGIEYKKPASELPWWLWCAIAGGVLVAITLVYSGLKKLSNKE